MSILTLEDRQIVPKYILLPLISLVLMHPNSWSLDTQIYLNNS
jgi:hypothetical protein